MTLFTLALRSLRHHASLHLGALLGAAIGSAVLSGALIIGDSVRGSLRGMALDRLGKADWVLLGNDRLFRAALGGELGAGLKAKTAPVLHLLGTANSADGSARANQAQVLGVEEGFWELAPERPSFAGITNGFVLLNLALAEQLKARPGDEVVIRVQNLSQLSRDAPLSPEEDVTTSMRVTVQAVVSDKQFGRFGLQASQIPPLNAYLPLNFLQSRLDAADKCNLLLLSFNEQAPSLDIAEAKLRAAWKLPDGQLEIRTLTNGLGLELRTPRVFLDPPATEAAQNTAADSRGVLTYFVNELKSGEKTTPYSMAAGMGPPLVPADLSDDEMMVNGWLAEDLGIAAGAEVELAYYIVGPMRSLEERRRAFRVRGVLPMGTPGMDASLMPDFPGLTDADNCRDWDAGFPIATDRIRDKDERYWDDYRGTPKAFVTLGAAQAMWTNRFGNLTAVRYPPGAAPAEIERRILERLDPKSVGLSFEPVRERALAASGQSQDFGQLFLGFSFFLIASALMLMALLFQFGVEQRGGEVGTLLAVGFVPRQVRRLFLWEGAGLALLGGILGLLGGIVYAKGMLLGLSTIWRDAVGTSHLSYHAEPGTLAAGLMAGSVAAWLTIWFAIRRQGRMPARVLLQGAGEGASATEHSGSGKSWGRFVGWGGLIGCAALIGLALARGQAGQAGIFFGAGALLLLSGLGGSAVVLTALGKRIASCPTVGDLGFRNATRRRRRSLAIVGLLASGTFLIVSIGVFRLDAGAETGRRSGTGGFLFLADASVAIVQDLNQKAAREFFNLDEKILEGVSFVPMRVRDGDDASCLNLNRAQTPRLLGVRPEMLADRNAFEFSGVQSGTGERNPWLILRDWKEEGVVPAIGDAASIQWALGKKLGDLLVFKDERGAEFKVRLAGALRNSVLQGNLLISEEAFVDKFPNEEGYRMFLADAPAERSAEISAELTRAMRDYGMELTLAARRLADFNAVQNTYLSTFQVLGGLGLLLGSLGLGVVVLRNVLDRRGELALLAAVGFRSRLLQWMVFAEHGGLLLWGIGIGISAALLAVLPAVSSAGPDFPLASLGMTVGLVLLSGAVWTWGATSVALRGRILDALRNT